MSERIGRYEILETLGKGGMGVVYRAHDPELDRTVAIKVVLSWAQYDEDAMARFNREARLIAQLQHPHIVTVFDAGRTEDGLPYFVMEYIEGTDLGKVLQRAGSLSPTRAAGYILQVCDGLSYAHTRDIVHRDIKPANLLITPEDQLKIVDFGIAKLVGTHVTGSGVSLGTPLYMAPEQVASGQVDHRTDVFAVGGVLYTLLVGRPPFEGPTLGAICHKIESEPPTPFLEQRVEVDPDLERIVWKALEKEPTARYESTAALAADLRQVKSRLETAASAPTVVTPRSGLAQPSERRLPTFEGVGRQRRIVTVVAILALVAAALWAWPGSPLRSSADDRDRLSQDLHTTDSTAPSASDTRSADQAHAGETDLTRSQALDSSATNPQRLAPRDRLAAAETASAANGNRGVERPTNEGTGERVTSEKPSDSNSAVDAQPATAFYPASQQERAAVNRIAAALVRGIENRDSSAIARSFGRPLTDRQWDAVERLIRGPRARIRHRLGEVSSSADGQIVAEVINDVLFLGPPGRVPPPRKTVWTLRFQRNESGRLELIALRPR